MINRTDDHYNFMQYNLGWATGSTMNYGAGTGNNQPREIKIRIRQANISNPASETFVVTQSPATIITDINCPFWQWGRKDPIPSGNGLGNGIANERTIWFGDTAYPSRTVRGAITLGGAIKNPFSLYAVSGGDWASTKYDNLWDITGAESDWSAGNVPLIKTVYDPNPVGFKMPPIDSWTRFTLNGRDTYDQTLYNISFTSASNKFHKGFTVFTQADNSGPTSFYPGTGLRLANNGSLDQVLTSGSCWAANHSANAAAAYYITYSVTTIWLRRDAPRAYGFPVRPVTD
jgi:hypothetical protein